MFHTVRRWWGNERGKVTTRLFLFEFVVVVVGVLTAQALASWVTDRVEQRAVNEEDERVRYEIGRTRQVARVWSASVPCLVERVESIARQASTNGPVDVAELKPPLFQPRRCVRVRVPWRGGSRDRRGPSASVRPRPRPCSPGRLRLAELGG